MAKTARAKAALKYIEQGFGVIPLREREKVPATSHGLKDATDNPEQVEVWWGFGRHAGFKKDFNVGLVLGGASNGIIALDIDTHGADGLKTLEEFELKNGKLPKTARAKTGSGGMHLLYRTSRKLRPWANPKLGIDLRADDSYIVAPPSIHPNGTAYEWIDAPWDVPVAQADDTVYALLDYCAPANHGEGDGGEHTKFAMPTEKLKEGQGRNDFLFGYARSLLGKGRPQSEIKTTIIGANYEWCDPPIPMDELIKTLKSAMSKDKREDTEADAHPLRAPQRGARGKVEFSSLGDIILEDDLACKIDGVLSVWNGHRWASDDETIELRSRLRAKDANSNTINEVYKYVACMAPKKYAASSFDNGYYCQFQNGVTIDMRTGNEVQPTPDMFITGTLNVDWNPDIGPNECDTFLDNISDGRADIKQLMLEVIGCCMLSRKPAKKAIMLVGRSNERDGNASNGKSSFIELIKNILGGDNLSYLSLQQLSERFMTHVLFGKMANLGDDIPAAFVDERASSDFKKLVTGETITADVKNRPSVSFQPSVTMVFSMNEIPRWSNLGGIERRLLFLPFFAHFVPGKPGYIKDIKELLGREEVKQRAAFLAAQVLPGLIASGQFTEVPEVNEELIAVMRDNDPVERWLMDAAVDFATDIVGITNAKAYANYKEWCASSGEKGISSIAFGKRLRARVWTDGEGKSWRLNNPRGAQGVKTYIAEPMDSAG